MRNATLNMAFLARIRTSGLLPTDSNWIRCTACVTAISEMRILFLPLSHAPQPFYCYLDGLHSCAVLYAAHAVQRQYMQYCASKNNPFYLASPRLVCFSWRR